MLCVQALHRLGQQGGECGLLWLTAFSFPASTKQTRCWYICSLLTQSQNTSPFLRAPRMGCPSSTFPQAPPLRYVPSLCLTWDRLSPLPFLVLRLHLLLILSCSVRVQVWCSEHPIPYISPSETSPYVFNCCSYTSKPNSKSKCAVKPPVVL